MAKMDLRDILNQNSDSAPPRSNSTAIEAHRELHRTPSNTQTLSPASSTITHGSPLSTSNHKRPAPTQAEPVGLVKRTKHRKYSERPIWAHLSPRNPRAKDGGQKALDGGSNGLNGAPNGERQTKAPLLSQGDSAPDIHWNKPWLNSIPLDLDLLKARRVLGRWEKSMKYNTPYPDLLTRVSDWIVLTLQKYADAVKDASPASFEIEAKIGTVIDVRSGQRIRLPVESMALLVPPSPPFDYKFESELQLADFISLNDMLNNALKDSWQTGREKIQHTRKDERDSFLELSPEGAERLPAALRSLPTRGKDTRLRTTFDEHLDKVTARIVKIPISHQHIHNPHGYDCRISINVEVDFTQNGSPNMIVEPTIDKPPPPDRLKHRLSYKHLDETYSVDLTTVQISSLAPKYELEVEVDSNKLMQQMDLMLTNKSQNAFSDIVSGFLDNTQFLMRTRSV